MKARTAEQIEAHQNRLFEKAFDKGFTAGFSGVSVLANPHPFGSLSRRAWAEGHSLGWREELRRFNRGYGIQEEA